jgi:hypothetical protein
MFIERSDRTYPTVAGAHLEERRCGPSLQIKHRLTIRVLQPWK